MELKNFNVSKETLEELENTTKKFLPILWSLDFEKLVNDVDNGNYSDVYSSDVFKTIIGMCKKENITSLKRGSFLLRARIIEEEDLYTKSKGIGFKDGRLNGYDPFARKSDISRFLPFLKTVRCARSSLSFLLYPILSVITSSDVILSNRIRVSFVNFVFRA